TAVDGLARTGATADQHDRERSRECEETCRHRLLPLLDDELRLLLARAIRDRELDVFRSDSLLELDGRCAAVVARMRAAAREHGHELVIAGLQVTDVEALHAALHERRCLTLRIQIVRDSLVVYLQLG